MYCLYLFDSIRGKHESIGGSLACFFFVFPLQVYDNDCGLIITEIIIHLYKQIYI